MRRIKTIPIYLKKVISKFWIFISFLPGLFGVLKLHFGLPKIIFSLETSIALFILLFFIASYLVWEDERKEKRKLQNKKPELKLAFEDEEEEILIKTNTIERNVKNSSDKNYKNAIASSMPVGVMSLVQGPFKNFGDDEINELHETFSPLKLELLNVGDVKATNIRINIYFPKNFTLLGDLPSNGLDIHFPNIRKNQGIYLGKKDMLEAWCNDLLPPDKITFDNIFIRSEEEGNFNINYEIFCEELGPKPIKGSLKIKNKLDQSIKEYPSKKEMKKAEGVYKEMIELQLKKSLD